MSVEEELNQSVAYTALQRMRHSAAHVMAEAVQDLFPGARFAIGLTLRSVVEEFGWGRRDLGMAVALFQMVSAACMYLAGRLSLVRALDGYGHLVTVHDDPVFYGSSRRQVADFVTLQQHADFYYEALAERAKCPWPVFNSEFGYEHGPAGLQADLERFTTGTDPVELAHRACEVVMAGAYPAYYYNHTAWDVVDYSYTPPGYGYMRILRDFFTSIPWWKMEPHPEMVTRSVRWKSSLKIGA